MKISRRVILGLSILSFFWSCSLAKESTSIAPSGYSDSRQLSGNSTIDSSGFDALYQVASSWTGGFTANVIITNKSGAALNNWQLSWLFPGDQKISNLWNGTYTQSGQNITVICAAYNSTIPAYGSVSFGFQASFSTVNTAPASFTLTALTASSSSSSSSVFSSSSAVISSSKSSSSSSSSQAASSSSLSGGLNPNVAPGGNFDLSVWELQLPIGSGTSPTTISPSKLQGTNGFQDIYFYTDKTDGAMVLMDPTTGITTSGSLHCRTELREVTGGWATTGINILSVTGQVSQVPDHTCIGQIFQASGPSKPLCELQYVNGGTFKLLLENDNQGGNATFYTVGSVASGSQYAYSMSLTGTTITITVNGAVSTFTLPPTFVGETFYFKAGDYDQTATAGTPGTTPGTVVKIYSLNITHK